MNIVRVRLEHSEVMRGWGRLRHPFSVSEWGEGEDYENIPIFVCENLEGMKRSWGEKNLSGLIYGDGINKGFASPKAVFSPHQLGCRRSQVAFQHDKVIDLPEQVREAFINQAGTKTS